MTGLVFVGPDAPLPSEMGGRVVLLDQTRTGRADTDPSSTPIHEVLGPALASADAHRRSLPIVDDWADAAGMVERLTIDDVAWWYRIRETVVGWAHERLVWRAVLAELEPDGTASVRAPDTEVALIDVARALGATVTTAGVDAQVEGPTARGPQVAALDLGPRLRRLEAGGATMILTHTGIQESVDDGAGGRRLVDPLVGPIIDRLRASGERPVVIGMGFDHRDPAHAAAIMADEDLLPASLLMTEWAEKADHDLSGIDAATGRLRAVRTRFHIDGADLTGSLLDEIERLVRTVVATSIRQVPRVGRALASLAPRAILLTHEGIRTPWLLAAHRAGIPVHALQHGVLYPTHPGYRHPRTSRWPLPETTFVFGRYERSVLLEVGGYLEDEVVASGSPRVDDARPPLPPEERRRSREELGVREGDRLVLVSTTFSPLGRRYLLHALRAVLGGPLPGVHLVFKQHPGETDDGPYRALVEGMAAAGGWAPPAMTVVRGRDLYGLLRAADAHLGYQSTVLTDAVVAGTPNLIIDVAPRYDLLGYVQAGVARPVRSPAELLEAIATPSLDPAARAAFLADHLEPGDAVERILARLERAAAVSSPHP